MIGVGTRMEVSPAEGEWLRARGLGSVREVLNYASSQVSAISGSSDIFRVDGSPEGDGPACVYVKRYEYPSWSRRFKQLFRGAFFGVSRARFEFEFLNEMRRRGIAAVRPVAFGEDRVLGFARATFLITEGEPGSRSLDMFVRESVVPTSDRLRLDERLVVALGRAIGKMHAAGVRHGGLYWRNILVREARGGGDWEVWFLDPDRRARLHAESLPREETLSDLAEFTASAMAMGFDRGITRFVRAYRKAAVVDVSERAVVRAVVSKARMLEKPERHRIAVSEIIGRLRRHLERREAGEGRDRERTLEEFFDGLADCAGETGMTSTARRRIVFDLRGEGAPQGRCVKTVTLDGDGYHVADGDAEPRDLTVSAEARAWLAIVNARREAFSLLRTGGIRVSGDVALLGTLLGHMGI